MKKTIYICTWILLGLILQLLIHAVFEIIYINEFLVANFEKYSLGLSWSQLVAVHHILSVILSIIGALFGLWQGYFWWQKIYNKSH